LSIGKIYNRSIRLRRKVGSRGLISDWRKLAKIHVLIYYKSMDESRRKSYKQISQMRNITQHRVIEQWVYAYRQIAKVRGNV
jgi:hypothetical protein